MTLIVQEAGDELLIYDLQINKAYCLNQTAAMVFQDCGGKPDFNELKNKHRFTELNGNFCSSPVVCLKSSSVLKIQGEV